MNFRNRGLIVLWYSENCIFPFDRGEDAINIYKAADSHGLTGKGYIWIVSQGAAEGTAKQHAPQGKLYHL